jgi:VanZ family protein
LRKYSFFIWLFIVFVITSIPAATLPRIRVTGFDILIHFFLYSVLTIFLIYSYGKRNWKFFTIIIIIAIIDEIHQRFIPGRSMSYFDMGVDFLGSGITFWLLKT